MNWSLYLYVAYLH